jgi:large subunit ribosomal protein L2
MAVIKSKPTSPGRRFYVKIATPELHKGKPYAGLVVNNPKKASAKGGRNSQGRVTIWQRGGGHKRNYRLIDWKRNKLGIVGVVERIEYDPNRTANIALVLYTDGERRYMVAPKDLKVGAQVLSGQDAPISVGNALPIRNIPIGATVHCIEMRPKKGAQLARSAGCSVQLLAKEGDHATLRLKSGEVRKVLLDCCATIGEVGNSEHNLKKIGKAGRKRWMGKRPHVRGVAMNPIDHPLGGGEGRTSGGRHPCSPWGQLEKKTRRVKRTSKMIIRKRTK